MTDRNVTRQIALIEDGKVTLSLIEHGSKYGLDCGVYLNGVFFEGWTTIDDFLAKLLWPVLRATGVSYMEVAEAKYL